MKGILTSFLEIVGLAYWLEITTENPQCIYYFGPFATREEAITCQSGYLDDLSAEGAINIKVNLQRRSTPEELTIFDESEDIAEKKNLVAMLN